MHYSQVWGLPTISTDDPPLPLPKPTPPPTHWIPSLLPLKGISPAILPSLSYIIFFILPDYSYQNKSMLFLLLFKKERGKKSSLDTISHARQRLMSLLQNSSNEFLYSSDFSPPCHSWTHSSQAVAHTLLQNALVKVKWKLYEMQRWILKPSRPWPVFSWSLPSPRHASST